jgi:hypothetical protein
MFIVALVFLSITFIEFPNILVILRAAAEGVRHRLGSSLKTVPSFHMVFLVFLGSDWELAAGVPSLKRSEPAKISATSSAPCRRSTWCTRDQELPQGVVQDSKHCETRFGKKVDTKLEWNWQIEIYSKNIRTCGKKWPMCFQITSLSRVNHKNLVNLLDRLLPGRAAVDEDDGVRVCSERHVLRLSPWWSTNGVSSIRHSW